ncbi:DUF1499 domain-containing protein [Falsirhodobacter sp. alg1]|uniref:DUF1499 domain-containing protein n=1 Tax=Falsirhodobacter sp. alg1 TaxID=1472418 RepID=UPI0005EE8C72|nr:DUF1499 domain-containing protein [Falsirhodobacter sp. alg1]
MSNFQSNRPANSKAGSSAKVGGIVLVVAILAVAATLIIMFGARLGLWTPGYGFGLYRAYANSIAYVVTGLALVALIYCIVRGGTGGKIYSVIALLLGIGLCGPQLMAKINPPARVPPIHDISTNTENPPAFMVIDDSRIEATNDLEYGGPEVAKLQHEAYPDVVPIMTDMSESDAYDHALEVAKATGWEIVGEDKAAMRFEATARTAVFYFADDIVVTVSPADTGSRVDMRSVSRIGRSDQGKNAERIRTFIKDFNE